MGLEYKCTDDAAVSKAVDGAVQVPSTVKKSVPTSSHSLGCAAVSKAVDGAVQVPSTVKKSVLTSSHSLGCAAVSKAVDGDVQVPPTVKKSILTSSYTWGRAAVSKIDKSVGKDAVKKMKKYLPGPENREKIVQALTHPATQEALNLVAPGVAEAANYLAESVLMGKNLIIENEIDEQNKYEHVIQQLKDLQAEMEKMQKQLNELVIMTSNNSSTVSEQKPEEVISHNT